MSIVRVTLWSNLGEAVQLRNVHTYQCVDFALSESAKTAFATRFTSMYSAVANWASTVWSAESVHFEELVAGVWQPRGEVAITCVGTQAGEILPFMNSALVLGLTGFAKTIGKKYLGGMVEALNLDGALVAGAIANFTSFLGYYIGNVVSDTDRQWVPGTVKADGTFHPFIGGRLNDLFATQRRRHPSVGI